MKRNSPGLPPLTVRLGQFATAGGIVRYVTPPQRPAFRVLDAPAKPTDRGVRIECAAPSLFVKVYVPLASEPGPAEPRALAGGLFDSTALKGLEGLEWSEEHALLSTAYIGLAVHAAQLGSRALVAPVMRHANLPIFPALPATDDVARVEEYPLNRFREEVIAAMKPEEKARMPGTTFAALAVLDKVNPACVLVARHDGHVVWSGQWHGLGVEVILPYVPRGP